jgi:hypothetical protein
MWMIRSVVAQGVEDRRIEIDGGASFEALAQSPRRSLSYGKIRVGEQCEKTMNPDANIPCADLCKAMADAAIRIARCRFCLGRGERSQLRESTQSEQAMMRN